MKRLCALAAILAVALAAAPALSAGPAPFKTGRYNGKTSQGFPISFSLRYIKTCGGREQLKLCLVQTGHLKIRATCSDGKTNTNPHIDIVQIAVGKSGVVTGTSGIERISWRVTVRRNGTLAGSMSYKGTALYSESVTCKSGKVSFTAKVVK